MQVWQNELNAWAPARRTRWSAVPCYFSAALVLLLALAGPRPSLAQATLHTILTNGPSSNRLNVVVLSEAYNSTDLTAKFLTDATNAVNNLLSYQPYQEYRSYFNAYAISVVSAQSGADHPAYSTFKNTYFNSSFDLVDYIITIPPNTQQNTLYADGQGKVDALLQSLMPQCGLPILLVNDPTGGGSGGPLCIISSADTSSFPEITVHESGHTLGGLGDEYGYAYADLAAVTNQQPNTTQTTNLLSIKWNAWIPANTPIPTPQSNQYAGVVGLFQGARSSSNGWYRPQLDCLMRNLDDQFGVPLPFCKVCSEALVKAICQKARPIDAFSPATNSLFLTTTQAVAFSVAPLQPATHHLSVQWFTNGVAVPGATNATHNLLPQNFPNGTYTLQAQVRDLTPLVRNDPSNLLSATVSWSVNISLRQVTIDSAHWLSGGQFYFRLSGGAPHGFVVQASTNLTSWTSLSTNNLVNGQFYFTNSGLANLSRRFYRALLLP
ncbi:MAG: IgA Peptidase [Pedosphaera sp.]|nr:IgA Peptidase [Pedosphaera sp.]